MGKKFICGGYVPDDEGWQEGGRLVGIRVGDARYGPLYQIAWPRMVRCFHCGAIYARTRYTRCPRCPGI